MTRNKLQVIDPNVNEQKLRDMGICLVAFLDAFRKSTNDDKCAVRLQVTYKSLPCWILIESTSVKKTLIFFYLDAI